MIRLAICRGAFMKRFVEGADRGQSTLLPECLDEWVEESNSVRVVDSFVDALDLADLGFEGVEPAATGRPAYHPSVLLKLYIYGYLNWVQSSRRLEPERNANRLAPAARTLLASIADNGVPVTVGLLLIIGGDLKRESFVMAEHGTAVEAHAG